MRCVAQVLAPHGSVLGAAVTPALGGAVECVQGALGRRIEALQVGWCGAAWLVGPGWLGLGGQEGKGGGSLQPWDAAKGFFLVLASSCAFSMCLEVMTQNGRPPPCAAWPHVLTHRNPVRTYAQLPFRV